MKSELQSRFNEGFVSLSMVQDSLQYTNIHGREYDYTSITGVHKSVIPHALLHGCCEIYSGSAQLHCTSQRDQCSRFQSPEVVFLSLYHVRSSIALCDWSFTSLCMCKYYGEGPCATGYLCHVFDCNSAPTKTKNIIIPSECCIIATRHSPHNWFGCSLYFLVMSLYDKHHCIIINHLRACVSFRVCLSVSVCVSIKSHLTSVRRENAAAYSAGN